MSTAVTPVTAARPSASGDLDDIAAEFAEVRRRLFAIAHRILGNRSEAEDIVQDAWIRWQMYDRGLVVNPTAFLVTTTTRLALNAAQSARVRRERAVGTWPQDPVDTRQDPTLGPELHEALEHGVALLFERLGPAERAAYVLRQAFDYPYPRIAEMLETSETNARQLVSRGSKHITERRPRPTNASDRHRVVQAFVTAARHGDVAPLERALVPAR